MTSCDVIHVDNYDEISFRDGKDEEDQGKSFFLILRMRCEMKKEPQVVCGRQWEAKARGQNGSGCSG